MLISHSGSTGRGTAWYPSTPGKRNYFLLYLPPRR